MDLEQFKSQIDIVEVIQSFIPLRKVGTNYQAPCPFHNEKSPSFVVSPSKQIFTCFGCGKSGDAITFLKEYKNLDFKDALAEIASMFNIPLPHKESKAHNQRKDIYQVYAKIQKSLQEDLLANQKLKGYVLKRLGSLEAIEKFGLGYFGQNSRKVINELDFKERELLKEVGFLNENNRCAFFERLSFALFNPAYKIIGFAGRTQPFFNFKNSPKYLNSKQSFVFNKSQFLYNFHLAQKAIKQSKQIIVCEGYMDSIALQILGKHNCVATCGTAFNTQHLAQIFKLELECQILFFFDNDNAGLEATKRALEVCFSQGYFNVGVIRILDKHKDAGEILQENLLQNTQTLLLKATDGFSFYLKLLFNEQISSAQKGRNLEILKALINAQKNPFLKQELSQKVATTLNINLKFHTPLLQENPNNTLEASFYKSVLENEYIEALSVEYLQGRELGIYEKSWREYIKSKTRDRIANELFIDESIRTFDIPSARKAMKGLIFNDARKQKEILLAKKDYLGLIALNNYLTQLTS
ncbi:DNA primase [Helicobacter sp. MIT 00-7814]|uniref:DNA primase n=1 Tax=unclassified Helicobacter TaxID=2593540 RepID=UPI000E1F49CF|nr:MULTISPECIES: DNA primase [unclassified Helicobacter]RDU51756.1 DNA primase [Helicobacter sp. MIT 00-7814]RDU51767.1 DNA primase [Helicobacter sp. MIT 99-10781]